MNRPCSRRELVTSLVEARFPLDPTRRELARYPWDADEPLVTLTARHLASTLRRYIGGELTAADVGAWADALELRDDVDFEDAHAAALGRAIFILANPVVNDALTPEVARQLLSSISERTA
jgi:hypothetical protein